MNLFKHALINFKIIKSFYVKIIYLYEHNYIMEKNAFSLLKYGALVEESEKKIWSDVDT